MKKLFIIAAMLMTVCATNAQTIVRNGNTFSQTSSRGGKKDTLVTKFKFEDSKGNSYPIIINKKNGRCYVWKKSSKTGKPYTMYMKEEVSRAVCKELGITYVEKKS